MADSLFIAETLVFNRSLKTCRVNASELCDSFGEKMFEGTGSSCRMQTYRPPPWACGTLS